MSSQDDVKYPEHEKMKEVKEESQAIGDFIRHSDYVLAEWVEQDVGNDYLAPVSGNINDILADYFGIDQEKIEQEKQQMLEEARNESK